MGVAAAQDLLEGFNTFAERSSIEGPSSDEQIQELRDVYGYRPEAAWEVASQRGDRHLRMQQNLAANADSRARIDDIVNASEPAIEILDALNERIVTAIGSSRHGDSKALDGISLMRGGHPTARLSKWGPKCQTWIRTCAKGGARRLCRIHVFWCDSGG
jgi:hypothetical protein